MRIWVANPTDVELEIVMHRHGIVTLHGISFIRDASWNQDGGIKRKRKVAFQVMYFENPIKLNPDGYGLVAYRDNAAMFFSGHENLESPFFPECAEICNFKYRIHKSLNITASKF